MDYCINEWGINECYDICSISYFACITLNMILHNILWDYVISNNTYLQKTNTLLNLQLNLLNTLSIQKELYEQRTMFTICDVCYSWCKLSQHFKFYICILTYAWFKTSALRWLKATISEPNNGIRQSSTRCRYVTNTSLANWCRCALH